MPAMPGSYIFIRLYVNPKRFAIPYYIVENSKITRIVYASSRNLLFYYLKLFIVFYQFLCEFLLDFNKKTIIKEYLLCFIECYHLYYNTIKTHYVIIEKVQCKIVKIMEVVAI